MVLQIFEVLPRKVNDLGSGIVAGALLLGQGLAGLLTSRPTRLALQSSDGARGPVVDVSVEAVQSFALLSRDTAVLLADGGVLWALLDLQSSVKLKAIARDVRVLYPRSSGESAFAIGDDGKGIALTLSRNEVGVRAFAIRGTLQACDVGEQVTYAVVEGDGGRQLHVHPGATPELGTSVRVTLPEGAASLDRVRGSQPLSAVFKRGDERVCVVTGAQKLEAKLIRLDAKPADVAVLDGSLLVAFVDGRLSLYNREAIDNAGDTPLAATASISLNAQGRPRVLLAGTSKASSTIWIGTTAGELFVAGSAATQGEAVSQRPAPSAPIRASEPRPELVAQLAARDLEIEELRAETERQRAANEEREAAQRKALADAEAAHHTAIEEADAGHLKAMAEAEAAYRKAIEDSDALHLKAIAETQEQKKATEEQLAARAAELEARTAELGARTKERDELQGELEAARSKLAAAEEQLTSRVRDLDARNRAYEDMRGEVSRLMADLATERERIEKTFPFGSDGLRTATRAREKLDGVLSQIQGLLFKRPHD